MVCKPQQSCPLVKIHSHKFGRRLLANHRNHLLHPGVVFTIPMLVSLGSSASALFSGGLALACAAPTRAPLEARACRRPVHTATIQTICFLTHIHTALELQYWSPRRRIESITLFLQCHLKHLLCLAKKLHLQTEIFSQHPHKVRQLHCSMTPGPWHLAK